MTNAAARYSVDSQRTTNSVVAGDLGDLGVQENLYVGGAAFGFEHVGDVAGGVVAEELAERFFVVGDAMFFDEGEKSAGV